MGQFENHDANLITNDKVLGLRRKRKHEQKRQTHMDTRMKTKTRKKIPRQRLQTNTRQDNDKEDKGKPNTHGILTFLCTYILNFNIWWKWRRRSKWLSLSCLVFFLSSLVLPCCLVLSVWQRWRYRRGGRKQKICRTFIFSMSGSTGLFCMINKRP